MVCLVKAITQLGFDTKSSCIQHNGKLLPGNPNRHFLPQRLVPIQIAPGRTNECAYRLTTSWLPLLGAAWEGRGAACARGVETVGACRRAVGVNRMLQCFVPIARGRAETYGQNLGGVGPLRYSTGALRGDPRRAENNKSFSGHISNKRPSFAWYQRL
jgi:hypothetical protein